MVGEVGGPPESPQRKHRGNNFAQPQPGRPISLPPSSSPLNRHLARRGGLTPAPRLPRPRGPPDPAPAALIPWPEVHRAARRASSNQPPTQREPEALRTPPPPEQSNGWGARPALLLMMGGDLSAAGSSPPSRDPLPWGTSPKGSGRARDEQGRGGLSQPDAQTALPIIPGQALPRGWGKRPMSPAARPALPLAARFTISGRLRLGFRAPRARAAAAAAATTAAAAGSSRP